MDGDEDPAIATDHDWRPAQNAPRQGLISVRKSRFIKRYLLKLMVVKTVPGDADRTMVGDRVTLIPQNWQGRRGGIGNDTSKSQV